MADPEMRLAAEGDLDDVVALYAECTRQVRESRGGYWHSRYPTRALIAGGVRSGTTWLAFADGDLAAAAVLDGVQADEYAGVAWRFTEGRAACIHRMAVRPGFQGRGIASALHSLLEAKAREAGCSCIRLDTWEGNALVRGMLERRGFSPAGTVSYPRTPLAFLCYEKRL